MILDEVIAAGVVNVRSEIEVNAETGAVTGAVLAVTEAVLAEAHQADLAVEAGLVADRQVDLAVERQADLVADHRADLVADGQAALVVVHPAALVVGNGVEVLRAADFPAADFPAADRLPGAAEAAKTAPVVSLRCWTEMVMV